MRQSRQFAGTLAGFVQLVVGGLRPWLLADLGRFSEAVRFRILVQISLSPWSDGQSGRLVQSSEVLSLLPLSAAGCGGYLVLVVLLRTFPVLVDSGDRIL